MNLIQAIALLIVIGLGWLLWHTFGNVKRKALIKRIERIQQRKVSVPKTMQDMSLRRKTGDTKGFVYWITKPLPDFTTLGDKLERAGKTISPKQFVFRRAVSLLIIVFVISVVFGKSFLLGTMAGLLFGVWVPLKLLQFSINKQNKAFLRLFPDAIDLIVRGLRSGLPVSESLVLVSHEVPEPVGGVFTNIANTMKLGVTMEKALLETAKRLGLTEFNFFTTSIVLQRETGGNLSEILNNLSEVLRGRYIMHMKIKALSSEARASAIIIGALPFVVIGAVSVLTPDYMTVLWTDYRGNIAAGIAGAMMFTGLFTMHRMTKFEI